MAKKISNWLYRFSHGWVALAAVIIFLLFGALVLPEQSTKAEALSAGSGTPDTSLFYSPDELYGVAEAYSAEGRAAYVRARFTFDLVFPLVFTFFLVTTLSWVYARGVGAHSP